MCAGNCEQLQSESQLSKVNFFKSTNDIFACSIGNSSEKLLGKCSHCLKADKHIKPQIHEESQCMLLNLILGGQW